MQLSLRLLPYIHSKYEFSMQTGHSQARLIAARKLETYRAICNTVLRQQLQRQLLLRLLLQVV